MTTEVKESEATGDVANQIEPIVRRFRLLEIDHDPDGWPAVKMQDISALCCLVEKSRINQDRLKRKIAKRDKRIAILENRVAEIERALGVRTIDLQSLSKNVEGAVTNALCNVRMIPVFGTGRDKVITEVRNVNA